MVVILMLATGVAAFAQGIPAAGDREDIWLLRKSGVDDVTVYHRSQSDPKDQIIAVSAKVEGRLTDNVIAAGPSMLWMIKATGWVESVSVDTNPLPSLPRYNALKSEQKLPEKAKPVACAAAKNGFWVLVKIENAADLKHFDLQTKVSQPGGEAAGADDLPPWFRIRGMTEKDAGNPAQTQPAPQTQPAVEPSTTTAFPVYRVLHLDGTVWQVHPAPDFQTYEESERTSTTQADAKTGPFGMVFLTPDDAWPEIFSQVAGGGIRRSTWKDGWKSQAVVGADAFDKAIVVDRQAVLVRAAKTGATGVSLYLGVISSGEVVDLPRVELGANTGGAWAAVPMDNSIAIIEPLPGQARGAEMDWKLSLRRIDLLGRPVGAAQQTLESKPSNLWNDSPNLVIFGCSLAVGLLLMWTLWGRDNVETSVRLPVGVVKADLPRRAFACLIDLVPCAWLSMLIYKVQFGELFQQIIELSRTWGLLKPWLVTIGLLAVYSAVSEVFYGRTLGKYLAGLRVTRLDASAPGALQVVVRNAIKVIEILCFPLMFIPVARLNAQRLGDMAARTIVVADEPPEEEDDEDFDDT
jgi:uncharacterized RDD family membrane protein YckC